MRLGGQTEATKAGREGDVFVAAGLQGGHKVQDPVANFGIVQNLTTMPEAYPIYGIVQLNQAKSLIGIAAGKESPSGRR